MANDAQCFTLGEALYLKKKNVIGLTLGTGVGGGIVLDGKLYVGKGNAGHLGHCTIKFDGRKSECHNHFASLFLKSSITKTGVGSSLFISAR